VEVSKSVLCQGGAHMKIGPQRGVALKIGCKVGILVVVVVAIVIMVIGVP
jgi:hypothetical protein